MAWNRPSENVGAKEVRSPKSGVLKGALAGLCVVVLAGVAIWLISGGETRQDAASAKGRGRIKEVTPAKGPKSESADAAPQKAKPPTAKPDHPQTNQWGNPKHWGSIKLRPAHTSRIDRASLPISYTAFEHMAERDIAGLLTIEPGTFMIAAVEFGDDFIQSFKESLKSPALVTQDDSEEVKELKRAVNEAKAELKARMDAGEDIAKIMNDTRKELYELGAYRDELQKMIDEATLKKETTREDAEDIVAAANKMLEERGAKKIVMPEMFYHSVELRFKKNKAREEANQ